MKKTMQKALRPLSSKVLAPPPNVRPRIIERMKQMVKEALNGSKLDARYLFLLEYVSTVVDFHNAADQKLKDAFFDQIKKNEDKGHGFGFDQEEIISVNFFVLQTKVNGELPVLAQRIKEKKFH